MNEGVRPELRFIAYREYPAPRTGSLAEAAVLVLHYSTEGGCRVSSWDANGRFIESKSFEKDIQANRYVNSYGDDETDRNILASDWKWPFTAWYELRPIDDFASFIAIEAQRGYPVTRFRCQVCGYKTIVESGRFEICRVCFWEDEGQIDPNVISGPNHITITEAQENFRSSGASKPQWKGRVRPPRQHEL